MAGEFTIIVNPDGSIQKKAEGFEGIACMNSPLSQLIDRTFGNPTKHEKTSAYYSQGQSGHVDARN